MKKIVIACVLLLCLIAQAEVSSTNGVVTTTGTVSGALTSVSSADSSIAVATGTTTPVLTCATASGSQKGCLPSADWTTFNNKQATVTASAPLVITTNNLTCNAASGSVTGCLSSTDWTTFNNKQATHTATAPIVVTGADISCTAAAAGVAGCVTTGAQTYDGVKTFSSVPAMSGVITSGTATYTIGSNVANGSTAVGITLNNATTFSTNGAKLLKVNNNGTTKMSVSKDGALNFLTSDQTGSPGSITINAASGKFAFASGSASTITITNSLVSGTSIILCTPSTTNTTATSLRCTAGAGGFDAQPNAAPTSAAWEVQFLVINQNVP